ncbi:hypothetical protein SB767_07680 [Bacillus sp. SIMBA_069]
MLQLQQMEAAASNKLILKRADSYTPNIPPHKRQNNVMKKEPDCMALFKY